MERARLEDLSLEELKQEALRFKLHVAADRNTLIDSIMTYLEKDRTSKGSAKSQQIVEDTTVQPTGASVPPITMEQMLATMNLCLEQQRRMMEEIQTLSRKSTSESSRLTDRCTWSMFTCYEYRITGSGGVFVSLSNSRVWRYRRGKCSNLDLTGR